MTANRWWVRFAARWLARIDGVKGQVQMFSLAVTAFSTFSIMLQGFGLGGYVPYIGIIAFLIGVVYTYLFTEGGVWNQVARDRHDLSTNYSHPQQRINTEFISRGVAAAIKGDELTEERREATNDELDEVFEDYRDGYDL